MNVKKEYWRLARAKCYSLFTTGQFTCLVDDEEIEGNIDELEGQLNFIDQVDRYNRMRQKPLLKPEYALDKRSKKTWRLLSGREKTFSRFLFYRLFYGNDKPTILCEGKTDNVYLKAAISELKKSYPKLVKSKNNDYKLLIRFVEYTKRTRFLLELFGGTDYLDGFIRSYGKRIKFYKAPAPQHPTIIFIDNDEGSNSIVNLIKSVKKEQFKSIPKQNVAKEIKKQNFIHIGDNLYVIFTPLGKSDCDTDIEYFFDDSTRSKKHTNGKCFNTVVKRNSEKDLSKEAFANQIVKLHKSNIDFDGFKALLDRIVKVIEDYDRIKDSK